MSAAQKDRGDHEGEGELKIRKLNEKYEKLRETIQSRLMSDHQRKVFQKARKKAQKAEKKAAKAAKNTDEQDDSRGRVYVLDFDGDIKASEIETHSNSNIKGNIKSKTASLGGKLKGNVNSDRINIKKTADIDGVLNQKTLSIEEGANLKIKTETYK